MTAPTDPRQPVRSRPAALAGRELRYALLVALHRSGRPMTVHELAEAVASMGLSLRGRDNGRAGKHISDALRWEVRRDRAVRLGRGWYEAGTIPKSTLWRAIRATRELGANHSVH